jgi:hypothetical protein
METEELVLVFVTIFSVVVIEGGVVGYVACTLDTLIIP